ALDPRLQQPEILELPRELCIDVGTVAELAEVELAVLRGEGAGLAAPTLLRGRRRELLADHTQRQELVPLQAQDRLQPVEVLLREQPVAALRSLRVHQPLAFQVADLRDRDVGELRLQALADRADRQQLLAGLGGAHCRKVRRYLPICNSSPSVRAPVSMRRRLRNVPFRLPRSSIDSSP